MSKKKWEKLAGEMGEEVPSGRWGRMVRLGGLGLRVGSSAVVGRIGNKLIPRSKEKKRASATRRIEKNAEKVVKVLGRLKGASMKVGQILSADPDLVPAQFSNVLSSLQKSAPPMTYVTVKEQIESSLQQPIEAIFSFFDPDPIGAASIGQVHRGTLKTGEDVAVKVQYPGIVSSIESDLKNLGTLLTLGRAVVNKKRLDEWLEEVERAVLEEADYTIEAKNLERACEVFEGKGGLRVPKPYPEWTREAVLTMEYIEGEKLDEALAELGPGPQRDSIFERFIMLYVWMFHEVCEMHADPHPGNFLLDKDDNLVVLDFGCVKHFEQAFTDGVLKILDAVWENDDNRAAGLYQELGFGKEGANPNIFDAKLIRQYHELILEPFLKDEPFAFGRWRVTAKAERFALRHPKILKLAPPADTLLYFRVLSGIKGLFMKLDAELNIHRMAVEVARRRGVLSRESR